MTRYDAEYGKRLHKRQEEYERNASRQMARILRLSVVQGQYDQGNLTEEQARLILSGRLSPDNPDTSVDDSDQLKVKP